MFCLCVGSYSDGDAIKVYVRVRPLTQGTGLTTDGDRNLCLTVTSPHTVRLHSKPEPRTFTYDHVADMDTSQESVFSSVAKNIVESCMNGYNGTIFAYGQTGSGKTFTMLGPNELNDFSDELRGVIPRSFEYLFFLINREVERSAGAKSFLCKCSFIEIYNEQIFDLLDSASASLFLREDIKKGVFVEGAVEKYAASAAEAYQVLSMGWRNRRVASTSMNRESSRSHAVFTMTLESKETGQEVVNIRTSQLNLVDLAGSERQRDTHAEGSRLKEASSINRSLMCLGQVIMALVDVSNGKTRHICYRDSKLTFLLRVSQKIVWRSYCVYDLSQTFLVMELTPNKLLEMVLCTIHLKQQFKCVEVFSMSNRLGYMVSGTQLLTAVLTLQALQEKVSRLEEAWAQKEKFIQSNRMILKFRDDRIAQLKRELETGQQSEPQRKDQILIEQLLQEIRLLREQVEHHPRMMWYAAENYSLKEEVRALQALESVKSAQEAVSQSAAELENAFQELMQTEEAAEASGGDRDRRLNNFMSLTHQDQISRVKGQLDEEEAKNMKLLQQISKLEEQVSTTTEQSTRREEVGLLRSEVSDLRLVLQSSDRELEAVRKELEERRTEQEKESTHLSSSLISTQLQLDKVRLEWEQLQEQQRLLQDAFDTLQAEFKFEADQYNQQLEEKNGERAEQQAQITVRIPLTFPFPTVFILPSFPLFPFPLSVLFCPLLVLHFPFSPSISSFLFSVSVWNDLTAVLLCLQVKYGAVSTEREEMKTQISHMHTELQELREASDRRVASDRIELDLLQEDLAYATEEVERLSRALEEQTASLQKAQLLSTEKEATIQTLQEQQQEEQKSARSESANHVSATPKANLQSPHTPHSFNRELSTLLESQERELESRRSSMMTMEVLLAELNAERMAKNEEIQRLKAQINEKENMRLEIQSLLEHFYNTQNQQSLSSNATDVSVMVSLQNKEVTLAQSQTCVQELTTELRNRCLELRELRLKDQEQEAVLQEVEVLRKQVDHLAEENGKLLGHQNHKQKIEYMVRLKKEIIKLQEVSFTLMDLR
uniref:Kinesin motor domain-containing protein n=1 Tax=Pygocentrus nattereri TaxID=42514 RepID=A0AAR2M6L2_PYGNA